MALSDSQKTSFVFKKAVSQVSETSTGRDFFEEPYSGRDIVLPSQVWNQAGSIPNSAPSSLTDGQTSGVVTRYIDRSMTAVSGASNAFYLAELVDAIPFNYGDGTSYLYGLKTSANSTIPFGSGDWVVNNASGTLLFYGSLPSGVSAGSPPKISFYRYTGTKGVGSGSGGGGGDVVNDLTPQLGGDLDLNSNDIIGTGNISISGNVSLSGTNQLVFGNSNNATLYNDGTDTRFASGGKLFLRGDLGQYVRIEDGSSNILADFISQGSVDLYYNNTKRLETTVGGIDVTGTVGGDQLNISGVSTFQGTVYLPDTSNNSTAYRISGATEGFLIQSTGAAAGRENIVLNPQAGLVELRYLGSPKLRTVGTGVSVTGDVILSGASILKYNNFTITYSVKVASKTSSHRYNGTGSADGYLIENIPAPFLNFTPGNTYRFTQSDSSNTGHPLRFYLDAAKTTQYTTNVTTSGTPGSVGAYTQITITDTTPTVLFYQCSTHDYMGNAVNTQTSSGGGGGGGIALTDLSITTAGSASGGGSLSYNNTTGVFTFTPADTSGGGGGGGISNVVEDTTPQLGGDLDLNGKSITGTGNLNVTGVITSTSFAGDGSALTGITLKDSGGNIKVQANPSGVVVTGVVTATQFKGDGSGLTGITATGSGIVIQDEGSNVGTAATVNFVGDNVSSNISNGVATISVGGLSETLAIAYAIAL